MSIVVTIIKAPETVNISESTKTFDEQGGTLGRGQNNAWILDDPERFLSSCHCQISYENGQYYITDTSTNGTFFDGAVNPMGKGTKLPLNEGSEFVLGDYEFSVSINQPLSASSDPFAMDTSSSDIFASPAPASDFSSAGDSPFGGGHVSSSESLFSTSAEETDPLAALDKAQGGSVNSSAAGLEGGLPGDFSSGDSFNSTPASDPFGGPSHSDQADPMNQQVSWPNSVPESGFGGGIPDDWDNDDLMSSAPAATPNPVPAPAAVPAQPPSQPIAPPVVPNPSQQVPQPAAPAQPTAPPQNTEAMLAQQQANEKIQSELEMLKQQISAQQRGVKPNVSVDTSLIEAMGLSNKNLVDAEINQMNQVVGEVVREMVSGLMQVLGSRSSIKNEFRMNVTTIQPVENNPLKFSANVDDALENMFIKQGNAYKKPVEAVRESFEGIAEHQVAILAGIRAAFKGVIERFDPQLLEQRFAKHKTSGIIPGSQKAKNWDLYLEYYNELAGDIDNSFQYLFGDEFVQAYEEQLQQLTIARKTQQNNSKKL